jgi:LysM repeat protein
MAKAADNAKLKKALIYVLDANGRTKDTIPACFYPTEYSMEKSNEFANHNIPGLESPLLQFVRGGLETLAMDLLFDTYEDGVDVRALTKRIEDLLKVDADLHAPPVLRVVWGSLSFTGVLARISKKFTMFHSDGTPARATLSVTFNEYKTQAEVRKPSHSPDRTKVQVLAEGDSLWALAAEHYGDAGQWRPIARRNSIDNPRLLPVGREIEIPPLEQQRG